MKTTFGNVCLVLALVSLSLAAAVSVNVNTDNGAAVTMHAATMELQGSVETDEGSAAPDADHKTAACAQRDCPAQKQEVVLVFADGPQSHESKAFMAPGEPTQPKSKE